MRTGTADARALAREIGRARRLLIDALWHECDEECDAAERVTAFRLPCWGRYAMLWGDIDHPERESVNSILYGALVRHGGMTPEEALGAEGDGDGEGGR